MRFKVSIYITWLNGDVNFLYLINFINPFFNDTKGKQLSLIGFVYSFHP